MGVGVGLTARRPVETQLELVPQEEFEEGEDLLQLRYTLLVNCGGRSAFGRRLFYKRLETANGV